MISNYFKLAIKSISRGALRSWLTILGIIIGIALVVTMISLGEGLRDAVLQQLRMFGSDLIWVMPGKGSTAFIGTLGGLRLTKDDVNVIEKTFGVKRTCPMAIGTFSFDYRGEKQPVLVCAHPDECDKILQESQAWSLYSGRFYKDGEKGLVIGYSIAKDFFDKELKPKHRIEVDETTFQVTGVLNTLGAGEMGDSFAFMPLDVYRDFTEDRKGVDGIIVQADPGVDIEKTAERIEAELRKFRDVNIGEEDFTVITNEQTAKTVDNIIRIIELVLIGITAIALVVGGIGIMNTMYTSIYEKTKDIGIMKAVGAKDRDIMYIFLIESSLLGLVGGIIGVIFGFLIAYTISSASLLIKAYYGIELVLGALFFSMIVGIISGLLPAMRAAALDPIEALRHE